MTMRKNTHLLLMSTLLAGWRFGLKLSDCRKPDPARWKNSSSSTARARDSAAMMRCDAMRCDVMRCDALTGGDRHALTVIDEGRQ